MLKEKSAMNRTKYLLCLLLIFMCSLLAGCFSALPGDDLNPDPDPDVITGHEKIFQDAYKRLNIAVPMVRKNKEPLVLVHYMPWYEAPPVAGYGGHWTGWGHFSPPNQIASHQMPLTGPYDSRDEKILEYQVKLMKYAGIDGVIFDWYGIHTVNDYGVIHESTLAMIEVLKREGLKFVICYEDQTVPPIAERTGKTPEQIGKETFLWMQNNWFTNDAYVKHDGRPVVMCFGPQHYSTSQWNEVFSVTNPRPYFVDLDNKTSWAESTYNWPPMWASEGPAGNKGELSISRLVQYLNSFYNNTKNKNNSFLVATAFPAFDDIYEDQGGASYGNLDYAEGRTFELTFTAAERAYPNIIQIATWNDYGEGTIIEPTKERGYTALEYLQDKQKEWNPGFPYNHDDLRTPLEEWKK